MDGSENTNGVKLGMVGKGVGEEKPGMGVVLGRGVSVSNAIVGSRRGRGVTVGMAFCVATSAVLTVEIAVCMISAWLIVGVDPTCLQETRMAVKMKGIDILPTIFTVPLPLMLCKEPPNGLRYAPWGCW